MFIEMRLRTTELVVAALTISTLWLAPSRARGCQLAAPEDQSAAKPEQTSAPPRSSATSEGLHVLLGRSLVISSPTRIKRVSIADPNVIDTLVVTPNQIVVNGKSPGASSLLIWDESGQSQAFDVSVDLDVAELTRSVQEAFPSEQVAIKASGALVTLSGQVSSEASAGKILQIAQAMLPKKEQAISLLQFPAASPSKEILLQVKFAEVDRGAISQLGINFISLPPAKNIGTVTTQQFSPPTLTGTLTQNAGGFTLSDLLNVFIFRPDINLAATIKALQERNLLQILAEPNVLTETGKEASFLAGGEFPFPVVQNTSGGLPVVTIQFREFGVKLNFSPSLTPDGRIHLKARPEVSSLDFSNALTLSGFLIPAISTRRVESEMDLQDGQSFAIAGLVDNRVQEQLNKIPGIGDVPILGKLFQSRNLNKSRNELLVVVTPRIVEPSPPGQLPAEPEFPSSFLAPLKSAPPRH